MSNPVSGRRLKAARVLCGLSQEQLSKIANVSAPRIAAVEDGRDALQSTITRIVTTLENRGIKFGHDGSLNIEPKVERFVSGPGHPSREQRRTALAIVNSARAARGQSLLIDEGD